MNNDIAISVSRLGKRYKLGTTLSHDSLREQISHGVKMLWGRVSGRGRSSGTVSQAGATGSPKEIWALKDVDLQVKCGEVVGIIGPNGAGKSTLLKILSRITEPTVGEIRIRGRVGSLLEVGTGMHQELSGKENVYLNGAILGMHKAEIDAKYEQIVDFSGIADFMSTPIKRYSSGMRVRLGFAIAAHLEPEILIVDEVLAVGDLNFQKKCLGKMEDVVETGRTVLFVSHRMEAIRALCRRTLLIDQGKVVEDGDTDPTIQHYHTLLRERNMSENTGLADSRKRRGSGQVRISRADLVDRDGQECSHFEPGEDIGIKLSYKVYEDVPALNVRIALRSGRTDEFVTSTRPQVVSGKRLAAGQEGTLKLTMPSANIRTGEYPLYLWLGNGLYEPYDVADDLINPMVIRSEKSIEDLGYDPAKASGYFDLESSIEIES